MKSRHSTTWAVLFLALSGCSKPIAVEDLPPADQTVAAVALRLGREKAPGDLTWIASRGDRVLSLLTADERSALARSALRFRVDRPVVVDVAVPAGASLFWLSDLGFADTGTRLRNEDAEFVLFRRSYAAGVVGLGVNGLDRRSRSRYVVFVKPREAGDGSPRIDFLGPEKFRTAPAEQGVSPYFDAHKPFEALPAGLADSVIIQATHEGRADGAIAHGRIWKTRQPSGPTPDQVVVSFGSDPARELSISWRTNPTVKASAVRFAEEADRQAIRVVTGDAHAVESVGLLNDPTILRHQVHLTGLKPDTRYAYSVGDGSTGGWSGWHSVATAPASPRDFAFLYMGDAQNELERWGDLLKAAVKHRPDAGFLILAGDLVDRGNERSNWDHFFLRAAGVFDSIPLMPAVGNHEYLDRGPEIYRKTFDLPHNGPPGIDPNLVYAFEYADAFVAVLDSNLAIHDPSLAKSQADWLDSALARTRATWKFVAFHHPVHASHPTRENPQLGEAWGPIFDKHHVDLVLQGHDHAYLRSHPMHAGHPVSSSSEGTVYVVSVSGEKFYGQLDHEYTAKGLTHVSTYQTIDVNARTRTLTYRAFDRDSREVDRLVIEKARETRRMAGRIGR